VDGKSISLTQEALGVLNRIHFKVWNAAENKKNSTAYVQPITMLETRSIWSPTVVIDRPTTNPKTAAWIEHDSIFDPLIMFSPLL
jgi:hypothetical protein